MAKFRDSSSIAEVFAAPPPGVSPAAAPAATEPVVHDRSIGDIIRDTRNLSSDQVERILVYQREKGVRFGEAAVALGFASTDDILAALSQQFHYPYAAEEQRKLSPELVVLNQPFSVQAEAIRAVRTQVSMRLYGNDAQPPRALAIVSPDSGDGKTYLAANLAASFAQLGARTLLVDADMRSPRQHAVFAIANKAGLSGILSGRAESKVIQQVVGVPSLYVLPVGVTPPNPLELVERPAFGLLMRELLSKFDHVVVDTPAAVHGADASVIAARCGLALAVARRNRSRVVALESLVSSLAGGTARLGGVIVNEF
jgi:chain length determinant protein tyrosine kinase EpsG